MPQDAIYFPWIDPPNRAMLATAILYWDHLYTIVPASIRDPYVSRSSHAAHQLGFLRPRLVDPDSSEVKRASEEFAADIDRRAINRDAKDARQRARASTSGKPTVHRPRLNYRLHPQKLSQQLRDRLWRNQRPDKNGFFRVAEGYGCAYMSRLAAVIARSNNLVPLTDRRVSRDVLIDRYVDEVASDVVSENEAALVEMSLSSIRLPANTPLHELMTFREDNYSQLEQYRVAIRSLARQASAASEKNYQQRELKRIMREQIGPAQEEIAAKLSESGFDVGLAAVEVSLSALVGFTSSGFHEWSAALGGAAVGFTFSCVRWRISRNKVGEEPFAYLATAKRHFHQEEEE